RAEVVGQRRTDECGAGVERGSARDDLDLDVRVRGPSGLEQQLEGGAGHAVDTGVDGGYQRHLLALACALERFDGAVEFLGHRFLDHLLAFEQIGHQADVSDVADDGVGFGDRCARARGEVVVAAGAETDEHDLAAGPGRLRVGGVQWSVHCGILAIETVALRPSGPRSLCFSTMRAAGSVARLVPAASSAAASDTEAVPVYLRTV